MRLFHFSDEPGITVLEPRRAGSQSLRPKGREWLNGPLVWAIDELRQPMYLFPRDCPRILIWPTPDTTAEDMALWWGERTCRIIAHIEWTWLDRLRAGRRYRYEVPTATFECLDDAGMWVSQTPVRPLGMEIIDDLPAALEACQIELRILPSLAPLRDAWSTSLHVSGMQLRNARSWPV